MGKIMGAVRSIPAAAAGIDLTALRHRPRRLRLASFHWFSNDCQGPTIQGCRLACRELEF